MRPSRQQIMMECAYAWSKRSTCFRLNVGCILVHCGNIVSHGYNGHRPGEPHCMGNNCPGVVPGNCPTSHAEVNAINRLDEVFRRAELEAYVTDSPCRHCAEELWAANVKKVYYSREYRLTEGIDFLYNKGVQVFQITPAGYIVEYPTRLVVYTPE